MIKRKEHTSLSDKVQVHHLHFEKVFLSTEHRKKKRKVVTRTRRHPDVGDPKTSQFTRVMRDARYNCVETVMWFANGAMVNLPKAQSTRIPLGIFSFLKKCRTHGAATPISNIDNFVKHIYREHNQEADHPADMEHKGQEKLISIGNTPPQHGNRCVAEVSKMVADW